MRRLLIVSALALLALSAPALAHNTGHGDARSRNGQSMVDPNAAVTIGGPFSMTNQAGKAVTDQDFHGRYMLLFFGFTNCPDVCPTEMATIAGALEQLGPELAAKLTPVMASIDPARDTPAALTAFAQKFDSRIQGLTGTQEQVEALAKAYKVYYARSAHSPAPAHGEQDEHYMMDHSSYFYLMKPDGSFAQVFASDTTSAELATQLSTFLTAQ